MSHSAGQLITNTMRDRWRNDFAKAMLLLRYLLFANMANP